MSRSHVSKRGTVRVAALLFAISLVSAAPLPVAWDQWLYWRAIDLPAGTGPQIARITIVPEIFRRANRDLSDVRMIDDQGRETPYVMFTREGSKRSDPRLAILHERSFAPGRFTQVVLEVSDRSQFHNSIEVHTPETDFIEWVSVEASDDGHIWRIVQPRAPIFRFQKDGHQGNQLVRYSENNAHFLRLRVLDGSKQFPIAGVNVLYHVQEEPERTSLNVDVNPISQSKPGRSTWMADLSELQAPVSNVRFDVAGPPELIRCVRVQGSEDNKQWYPTMLGEIYRYHSGDASVESLEISGSIQSRYLQIEVLNGNDAPLSGVRVSLLTTPRHVFFEHQPERSYRLIYGDSRASFPQYDLPRRFDTKQSEKAVIGKLGPEEVNSAWSDPRPWTEKHQVVLWLAVGLAVVLLGFSAISSLRRSAQNSEG